MFDHHHLRKVIKWASEVLWREHLCQGDQLKIATSCHINHHLLVRDSSIVRELSLLLKRVEHGSTVHVLNVLVCVPIIVPIEFSSDHLLIELKVGKWLHLAYALQLMRIVIVTCQTEILQVLIALEVPRVQTIGSAIKLDCSDGG
jgi:hypothetical protein